MSAKFKPSKPANKNAQSKGGRPAPKGGTKPKGPKSPPTAAVPPTSGPRAKKAGSAATKATKRPVANDAPHAPPASSAPTGPTKPAKRPPVPLAKSNPRNQPKHVSAIDAAAMLLAEAKEPMSCKALIETMAQRGLWKPATGKTPEATLYAAIHREIAKKKSESRFRKAARGRFELAGKGA